MANVAYNCATFSLTHLYHTMNDRNHYAHSSSSAFDDDRADRLDREEARQEAAADFAEEAHAERQQMAVNSAAAHVLSGFSAAVEKLTGSPVLPADKDWFPK